MKRQSKYTVGDVLRLQAQTRGFLALDGALVQVVSTDLSECEGGTDASNIQIVWLDELAHGEQPIDKSRQSDGWYEDTDFVFVMHRTELDTIEDVEKFLNA
jgi:hypothetical protein